MIIIFTIVTSMMSTVVIIIITILMTVITSKQAVAAHFDALQAAHSMDRYFWGAHKTERGFAKSPNNTENEF